QLRYQKTSLGSWWFTLDGRISCYDGNTITATSTSFPQNGFLSFLNVLRGQRSGSRWGFRRRGSWSRPEQTGTITGSSASDQAHWTTDSPQHRSFPTTSYPPRAECNDRWSRHKLRRRNDQSRCRSPARCPECCPANPC